MRDFLILAVIGFYLSAILANAVAGEADQFVKVESKGITRTAQRSYIAADNGKIIARLYLENREDIPIEEVPANVQNAFIAIEDERFYRHKGVDYYGVARALLTNLKAGHIVEGGSTITQQYVKNSVGADDKTLDRKIREAVMATRLEKKYSKKQILEAYLNTIYFGESAYGIEAASEVYFGKKAERLTLAEGAMLAGITKSPNDYSPHKNQRKALERQKLVLNRMVRLKLIKQWQATSANYETIHLAKRKPEYVFAPHFVEYVKQQLIREYGVERVFKGGLRVHTTLNIRAQQIADQTIAKQLNRKIDPEAALVSINPKNGHIVAMAGGRDFKSARYNLATQGKRQPGSSFKAFVLVTALKQGIGPNDRFDSSSPQVIRVSNSRLVKPWIVRNSEGKGYGMMSLRSATVNSVNAVYANLTMKVKPENVVKTAQEMGVTTKLDPYPSIGIGGLTVGVSPLEMASAYGTLATGGIHVNPIAITSINDSKNKMIKRTAIQQKRVLSPLVSYTAIDIMKGVIEHGTATRANIGRPAAGKTGTNAQYRDAWFVGFTPHLVTAVWMGYPQAQISMYNVHGNRGFGGIIPASIWGRYTKQVLINTPKTDFPKVKWIDKKTKKKKRRLYFAKSNKSKSLNKPNKPIKPNNRNGEYSSNYSSPPKRNRTGDENSSETGDDNNSRSPQTSPMRFPNRSPVGKTTPTRDISNGRGGNRFKP